MRLILFLLASCFLSGFAFSQTSDSALNRRLADYFSYSKDLDISQLMNYTYPRVFEMAPKEQLEEVLRKAYANAEIKVTLDSLKLVNITGVQRFSNGWFVKFSYNVRMQMKVQKKSTEQDIDLMLDRLKTSFGERNVFYNEFANVFLVNQIKDGLAIKDSYSSYIWTMIGLEGNKKINSIIPEEIKKKYNIQ